MDKLIGELNKNLEKLIYGMSSDIEKEIKKAFKEEASISIERHKDGSADLEIQGKTLPILVTLAGLEKGILRQLEVPDGIWEMVKNSTGTREADDE